MGRQRAGRLHLAVNCKAASHYKETAQEQIRLKAVMLAQPTHYSGLVTATNFDLNGGAVDLREPRISL